LNLEGLRVEPPMSLYHAWVESYRVLTSQMKVSSISIHHSRILNLES